MNLFAETWQYLADPDSWTGAGGLVARLLEQLLLTATALVVVWYQLPVHDWQRTIMLGLASPNNAVDTWR
jgi:osmoprotectant transport system permease protein